MGSDFWETLERVAGLADGPPVVRPRLVVLADQPTWTNWQNSTTPSSAATPGTVEIAGAAQMGEDEGSALASTVAVQPVQPPVASGSGVRPGSLATPVARAGAIFDALGAIEAAPALLDLGRHEVEGPRPALGEGRDRGADVPSWDDLPTGAVPSGFLAGLVAKHRVFEETGEIDIDLDRPGRRRRRRGRRGGR